MKMVFIVQCEHHNKRVMELLNAVGIDYYTRWDQAQGKGHGTEPHLGRGTYASTNSVMIIAFQDEAPLEALIQAITEANSEIKRAADRIRLFQLPLERMV
jgi:nitrogen regulatory protein PII